MANIPYDAVMGCVEDVVERCSELDYPQARAEVPARLTGAVQKIRAQVFRQPLDLFEAQRAGVTAAINLIEDGR